MPNVNSRLISHDNVMMIFRVTRRYCECFANGEYCEGCDCHGCYNTEQQDEARIQAIKSTIMKNPDAFRPKLATATTIGAISTRTTSTGSSTSSQTVQQEAPRKTSKEGEEPPNYDKKRQNASTLEDHPTIDVISMTKHIKGCNCRRSHCLKKYCECFQSGVLCTGDCTLHRLQECRRKTRKTRYSTTS